MMSSTNKRIKLVFWGEVEDAINNKDLDRVNSFLGNSSVSPRWTDSSGYFLGPGLGGGRPPSNSTMICGLLDLLNEYESNTNEVFQAFRALLRLHCDATTRNEHGQTALHILGRKFLGHDFKKFMQVLVDFIDDFKFKNFINAKDNYGRSALYYAVDGPCQSGIVHQFLSLGANPFVGDPTDVHVLHQVLTYFSEKNADEGTFLSAVAKLLNCGVLRLCGTLKEGQHYTILCGTIADTVSLNLPRRYLVSLK